LSLFHLTQPWAASSVSHQIGSLGIRLIREAGLKNGHGGFFAILINERGIGREENKLSSGDGFAPDGWREACASTLRL